MERPDAVIKTVPGVTGIADNVLPKGDSKTNHDMAVLSLLETAQNNSLKCNPHRIQDKKVKDFGAYMCRWDAQMMSCK